MLHATPVTDSIDLEKIADATKKDKTLQQLTNIIKNGLHIRKSADTNIRKFEQIITEISVCGSGILLKGDRIILPESLQETAIQIAHRGSHPGQSGIERRLRSHFFFHNMLQEVQKYCQVVQSVLSSQTRRPKNHRMHTKFHCKTGKQCQLTYSVQCHHHIMWWWYRTWHPGIHLQNLYHPQVLQKFYPH